MRPLCSGRKESTFFPCLKKLCLKKIQEILTKTGPEAIYIAGKNENSFTLGVDALLKLLRSEVATSSMHQEVGALISVTETPMLQLPGNSTSYISRSSLKDDLFAVDLNAGCWVLSTLSDLPLV